MSSKTKINLLQFLNQFVVLEFLGSQQPILQEKWQHVDTQKRLANIVGVKPREILQGPQRNISAYLFFCEDKRKEILEQNPGIKPNKVMILFGEYWRKLSEDEKAPYIEKASKDKDRYTKYLEESKVESKKEGKQSVYNLFCSDERKVIKAEKPELSNVEIRQELAKRWKEAKTTRPQELHDKYGYVIR
jgi:hypothetical protein